MAKVIRLEHGGGAVVVERELTIEQAQSLAERLAAVGEPAGCCWCVGLWDEEGEEVGPIPLIASNYSVALPRRPGCQET
jgi:hypothetical protein